MIRYEELLSVQPEAVSLRSLNVGCAKIPASPDEEPIVLIRQSQEHQVPICAQGPRNRIYVITHYHLEPPGMFQEGLGLLLQKGRYIPQNHRKYHILLN